MPPLKTIIYIKYVLIQKDFQIHCLKNVKALEQYFELNYKYGNIYPKRLDVYNKVFSYGGVRLGNGGKP